MTSIDIRRSKRVDAISFSPRNILPIAGAALTAGTVTLCNTAEAQTFVPIGPVYPGERIVSERVITPKAEPLPAPSNRSSTRQEEEPVSLSDSLRSQAQQSDEDAISSLSLGSAIWQRMLTLERENAELTAMLDYERRLATYREHSENKQAELIQQSNELKQQLAKLEKGRDERLVRAEAELQETRHELFQLASELQRARQDLRYLELDRNVPREPRDPESEAKTTRLLPDEHQLAERPTKRKDQKSLAGKSKTTSGTTNVNTKGKRPEANEPRLHRVDKHSAPTTKASKKVHANRTNHRRPGASDPTFDPDAWMRVETGASKVDESPGLQGGPLGPLGKSNISGQPLETLPKPKQAAPEVLPSPKLPAPAKSKQPSKGDAQSQDKDSPAKKKQGAESPTQ